MDSQHVWTIILVWTLTQIDVICIPHSECTTPSDIRDAPGILTSHPGYGQSLAPVGNCEWVITPPEGKYVSLKIEDTGNTSCDSQLTVTTEVENDRLPGWTLCTNKSARNMLPLTREPHHLASGLGKWVRLQYKGSPDNRGFQAVYDFKDGGCEGHRELAGGAGGWLASHPGAGRWAVMAGGHCSWTVSAPRHRYVALRAGPVWLHCLNDWQTLGLYDGRTKTRDNGMAMISCTNRIPPMAASGRHLYVEYMDRWASNSLGFNITYEFYPRRQSGCGGDYLLRDVTGWLFSQVPPTSGQYFPWSRCKWRLEAPLGVAITLRFDTFDVTGKYADGGCSRDMLVIHDGSNNRSSASGQVYCNGLSQPPSAFTSASNALEVQFFSERLSNKYPVGKGFAIRFSRNCPNIPKPSNTLMAMFDENRDGNMTFTSGESVTYECLPGYVQVAGDKTRTCQEDGKWNGSNLLCNAIKCPDVPRPDHTNVRVLDINLDGPEVVTYQEVVYYTCAMGYVPISGSSRRRCLETGKLSGRNIECKLVLCDTPPTITHATYQLEDTNLDGLQQISYQEQARYWCMPGYTEYGGASMRTCQADGSYSGTRITCKPKECTTLPSIPHASVNMVDTNHDGLTRISYGEHVTFSCEKGYMARGGSIHRTCQADDTFNGTDLLCEAIQCLEIPITPNVNLNPVDTNKDGKFLVTYGEVIKAKCAEGFTTDNDDVTLTCTSGGVLTGRAPVCTPLVCQDLPDITHGLADPSDSNSDGRVVISYLEHVIFTCARGYYVSGGDAVRWCLADGRLNGTDITCLEIECAEPVVYDFSVNSVPRERSYLSRVNYTCKSGYTMSRDMKKVSRDDKIVSHVCDESGQWSGPEVKCVAMSEEGIHSTGLEHLMVTAGAISVTFLVTFIGCLLSLAAFNNRSKRKKRAKNQTTTPNTDNVPEEVTHEMQTSVQRPGGCTDHDSGIQTQQNSPVETPIETNPSSNSHFTYVNASMAGSHYYANDAYPSTVQSAPTYALNTDGGTWAWYPYWTNSLKPEEEVTMARNEIS